MRDRLSFAAAGAVGTQGRRLRSGHAPFAKRPPRAQCPTAVCFTPRAAALSRAPGCGASLRLAHDLAVAKMSWLRSITGASTRGGSHFTVGGAMPRSCCGPQPSDCPTCLYSHVGRRTDGTATWRATLAGDATRFCEKTGAVYRAAPPDGRSLQHRICFIGAGRSKSSAAARVDPASASRKGIGVHLRNSGGSNPHLDRIASFCSCSPELSKRGSGSRDSSQHRPKLADSG